MDEYEIKQAEAEARQRIKKLGKKPNIEKVSDNEVYLLDRDNNRIKKICGKLDDDKWPCTVPAGQGTLHVGDGKCKAHESKNVGEAEYLERLEQSLQEIPDNELTPYIKESENTQKEELFSIERLLRRLDAYLNYIESRQDFDKNDIRHSMMIIDNFRKLLETNLKQEQNKIWSAAIAIYLRSFLKETTSFIRKEDLPRLISHIESIEKPKELEDIDFEEVF